MNTFRSWLELKESSSITIAPRPENCAEKQCLQKAINDRTHLPSHRCQGAADALRWVKHLDVVKPEHNSGAMLQATVMSVFSSHVDQQFPVALLQDFPTVNPCTEPPGQIQKPFLIPRPAMRTKRRLSEMLNDVVHTAENFQVVQRCIEPVSRIPLVMRLKLSDRSALFTLPNQPLFLGTQRLPEWSLQELTISLLPSRHIAPFSIPYFTAFFSSRTCARLSAAHRLFRARSFSFTIKSRYIFPFKISHPSSTRSIRRPSKSCGSIRFVSGLLKIFNASNVSASVFFAHCEMLNADPRTTMSESFFANIVRNTFTT